MSKGPKKVNGFGDEAINKRVNIMLSMREIVFARIEDEGYETVLQELRLMPGNEKTGINCWTNSLAPIIDCVNCFGCKNKCYDIRNDCFRQDVMKIRALNSALHEVSPQRYWEKVGELIHDPQYLATELRINIGGDLRYMDFHYINDLVADVNPGCDILFFTKNYEEIDEFLDEYKFRSNVKAIRSIWEGMDDNGNRHNMPCSHVVWQHGTTAPKGYKICGGNCSLCHFYKTGCWYLKKGEHVGFDAH